MLSRRLAVSEEETARPVRHPGDLIRVTAGLASGQGRQELRETRAPQRAAARRGRTRDSRCRAGLPLRPHHSGRRPGHRRRSVSGPARPPDLLVRVWIVAIARIYVGAHFPLDTVGGTALGWVIGAGLHLAWGALGGQPTPARVREALQRAGIEVSELRLLRADARGSAPFLAQDTAGVPLFVKAVAARSGTPTCCTGHGGIWSTGTRGMNRHSPRPGRSPNTKPCCLCSPRGLGCGHPSWSPSVRCPTARACL